MYQNNLYIGPVCPLPWIVYQSDLQQQQQIGVDFKWSMYVAVYAGEGWQLNLEGFVSWERFDNHKGITT